MEWHSELPDGRDVAIRRTDEGWIVECGESRARSQNLDVALVQALRADSEIAAHAREIRYAAWARGLADTLADAEREVRTRKPLPST
jgi:hypothetical protein